MYKYIIYFSGGFWNKELSMFYNDSLNKNFKIISTYKTKNISCNVVFIQRMRKLWYLKQKT